MRWAKKAILLVAILLMLAFHGLATHKIHTTRDSILYHNTLGAPLIPNDLMMIVAGEFKGLVSDFLLLEISAFIDGARSELTAEDWDRIVLHFSQAVALDPYFRQTYQLIQSYLPWKGKAKEANALLEISKTHLTWDWYPVFFIGFNHFYFLNDHASASKYLIEASKYPGAPAMLATLGARMSHESGQTAAAIVFLKAMYNNPEYDEDSRKLIKMRIDMLDGVLILERAIKTYEDRFGRPLINLDDLVSSGILAELPRHPESREFTYTDGKLSY